MAKVHPHSASTDFSTQHFWSAQIFAEHAAAIEREFSNREREPGTYARHQAYASGSVLCAVAFLEAYINELFEHCAQDFGGAPGGLAREQQAILGRMWRRGVPRTARYGVLEKYDIALDLVDKNAFDRGELRHQDASSLVALRNALVHYEPELYPVPGPQQPSVDPAAAPILEKRLRGKFSLNPFASSGYGFFPDHCLSAGCAEWSANAALAFAQLFIDRMGIVEHWKGPLAKAAPKK